MASNYHAKQHYRQKERNSRKRDGPATERKTRNERTTLTHGPTDNIYLNNDRNFRSNFDSQVSVISDDAPRRPSIDEVTDVVNLDQWITTHGELLATPLVARYIDPDSMRDKCRIAEPTVDDTILHDLRQVFPNLSPLDLSKLIRCCHKLPYWIRSSNGELYEDAKTFMSHYNLTEAKLERVNEINKNILLRSSYGVLFVQGNKFFAKTNPNDKQRLSAIETYPTLKSNGEFESPWETAVRITERDVQYLNEKAGEWQWFDMNQHIPELLRGDYLECLITDESDTKILRYIGLFIISLEPDTVIRTNDYDQADFTRNWYSINEGLNNEIFYSIGPFLEFLHETSYFVEA